MGNTNNKTKQEGSHIDPEAQEGYSAEVGTTPSKAEPERPRIVKKNKGGRPTSYKPEYVKAADEYLENHQDEYELSTNKLRVKLPTIEGFARYLDVNKTTLYEWADKYPEFSNSLEKIKVEQQERLLNSGLSGEYNSTIAKLVLSANHGMREKTETDLTSGGEKLNFTWGSPKK